MANVEDANTFFIDTATANLTAANSNNLAGPIRLRSLLASADGGAATLYLNEINDGVTAKTKIKYHLPTDKEEAFVEWTVDTAPVFKNGLNPGTVTNVHATLTFERY